MARRRLFPGRHGLHRLVHAERNAGVQPRLRPLQASVRPGLRVPGHHRLLDRLPRSPSGARLLEPFFQGAPTRRPMIDIRKLNSATKYPSILTYHEMGGGGRLTPKIQVPFAQGREIHVTEKVDGTNARIVLLPDSAPLLHHGPRHWLIGSREELLTAQHDLVYQTDYGIVDALRPIADALPCHPDLVQVWFFEVFGGDLPASKQYTDAKSISFRLFDQASIPTDVLEMPIEKIAAWRDHGGQMFKSEEARAELLH